MWTTVAYTYRYLHCCSARARRAGSDSTAAVPSRPTQPTKRGALQVVFPSRAPSDASVAFPTFMGTGTLYLSKTRRHGGEAPKIGVVTSGHAPGS